eukprot:COSAG02_NODE_340_length_24179_cov_6.401644_14_plen_58_part_00
MVYGPTLAFIIGGISEVVKPGAAIARMASDAMKTVVAGVMGMVVWFGFSAFQAHVRS